MIILNPIQMFSYKHCISIFFKLWMKMGSSNATNNILMIFLSQRKPNHQEIHVAHSQRMLFYRLSKHSRVREAYDLSEYSSRRHRVFTDCMKILWNKSRVARLCHCRTRQECRLMYLRALFAKLSFHFCLFVSFSWLSVTTQGFKYMNTYIRNFTLDIKKL